MTNEKASFILANIDRRVCDDELNDALDVAIKALEQEDALDKIRAEIEQITDKMGVKITNAMGVSYNQYVSKIDVLQIIDKYKEESEDKG